jgi:transposase-like protein
MAKKAKWRRHSVEFKRQAVEQMKTCENIQQLARELDLERKLLYTWKQQLEGRPESLHANLQISPEERKQKQLQSEIAKLKSALADKTMENDFFRSALLAIKVGRQTNTAAGATASTISSGRGRKSKAV